MNNSKMQTIRMQAEKIRHYMHYVRSMNRIISNFLINRKDNIPEIDVTHISEINMIYTKRLYDCISKLYHTVECSKW